MTEAILSQKQRLSNVRARLQLTQEQLADRARISRETVSNVERGRAISRINAYALLNVLNPIRKDIGMPELDIHDLDWKIRGE